jgi:hypothetical protein
VVIKHQVAFFCKVIGATVKKDGELLESLDFDAGGISKSVDWQGGGEFIYFELDKYNQKYIHCHRYKAKTRSIHLVE